MILSKLKRHARALAATIAPGYLVERHHNKFADDEIEVAILDLITPANRNAIDVGTNWGVYARALSVLCPHVQCLEPNPALARLLQRTLPENCTVLHAAASDKTGPATLHIPVSDGRLIDGLASLNAFTCGETQAIEVQCLRIDDIGPPSVGFIKIDVEGAEEQVLAGAQRMIAEQRPVFLIEIENRHSAGALERINADFARQQYQGLFVDNHTLRVIDAFDHQTMQNIENFDPAVHRRSQRYINNFIFMPTEMISDDRENQINARLAQLPAFGPAGRL
ncbi:MAG: FkbM family methyltransferase [Beijerinckiaceae bacterium]